MTSLSAALRQELPRLGAPARALIRESVEPQRLMGLLLVHLWRFMLVLGLGLALFGAGRTRGVLTHDLVVKVRPAALAAIPVRSDGAGAS
jgi:hypothetical protein